MKKYQHYIDGLGWSAVYDCGILFSTYIIYNKIVSASVI